MKKSLLIIVAITLLLAVHVKASAQLNYSATKLSLKDFSQAVVTKNNINNSANGKTAKVRSSQQAAQMVKSRYGGKVLKVSKQGNSYSVKLLKSNGHVVYVSVNAITGQIR